MSNKIKLGLTIMNLFSLLFHFQLYAENWNAKKKNDKEKI